MTRSRPLGPRGSRWPRSRRHPKTRPRTRPSSVFSGGRPYTPPRMPGISCISSGSAYAGFWHSRSANGRDTPAASPNTYGVPSTASSPTRSTPPSASTRTIHTSTRLRSGSNISPRKPPDTIKILPISARTSAAITTPSSLSRLGASCYRPRPRKTSRHSAAWGSSLSMPGLRKDLGVLGPPSPMPNTWRPVRRVAVRGLQPQAMPYPLQRPVSYKQRKPRKPPSAGPTPFQSSRGSSAPSAISN